MSNQNTIELSKEEFNKTVSEAVEKALHQHTIPPTTSENTRTPQPLPSTTNHQEAHPIYDFMQSCPNCGQANTEYKPTKYRCTSCKVPVVPERTDKCWNCGNREAEKTEEEEDE